jgi:hypothetical protein
MGSSYAGAIHGCMEGLGRNVRRMAWLLPTCRNYLHNVMRMLCLEHGYRSRLLSHVNMSQLSAQRHEHAMSRGARHLYPLSFDVPGFAALADPFLQSSI